jgi:hypothetical protein
MNAREKYEAYLREKIAYSEGLAEAIKRKLDDQLFEEKAYCDDVIAQEARAHASGSKDWIHPAILVEKLDAVKKAIHMQYNDEDSCDCGCCDDHAYEEECTCCECNNLLERVEDLEEDGNTHEDVFDEVYHKLHHMEELVAWQDEMIKKLITKIGTLETRMNMPMNDGVIKALADRVYELEKLNPTRSPLDKTKLEWSNSTKGFCDF